MATSSLYYIDSSSFNTAVSVYTNPELTIKAPDGYYSIDGLYRRQLFGKLQSLTSCTGSPIPVNCVVSDWSAWSECVDGFQTRTRTVITPASSGGTACPSLSETQACTPVNCLEYLITNNNDPLGNSENIIVTYIDCGGNNAFVEIAAGSHSYICAQEASYVVPPEGAINISGTC